MTILGELGRRIREDTEREIQRLSVPRSLAVPEPDDDHVSPESMEPGGRERAVDTTIPAVDGGNPNIPTGMPVEGIITSGFGMRMHPIEHRMKPHGGIDIAAPLGTAVRATAAGRVTRAEMAGKSGNLVEIDHGRQYATRYAHLNEILVSQGEEVARGDVIGTVGNTGASTGPHLHYCVVVGNRLQDPRLFMEAQA